MGNKRTALELLESNGITLTLVDVGASLAPFEAFVPLLRHARYVGFDPDRRELLDEGDGSGRRKILDTAVVAEPDGPTTHFFLTRNPTCSSTLRPDDEVLSHYLHAYRFEVVGEEEVLATTLGEALASVGVDRVDWIKLDTQGTDLRLLRSLVDNMWAGLMCVDAEPGFDQYYEGEDTFGELHREMTARGFWMSDLALTTAVRLRRPVFDETMGGRTKVAQRAYEFSLKQSPTAAGPRYLRTIESLQEIGGTRDDHLRLWACTYFSGNHPHALDVIAACESIHGSDDTTTALRQLTIRRNKRDLLRNAWKLARKLTWRNLRRLVTKPY